MTYTPKVNDCMKWTDSLGKVTEGWVYFICKNYFTNGIGVKDKPDNLVDILKEIHTLVLCQNWYWDEVEYIKTRKFSVVLNISHKDIEILILQVSLDKVCIM